MSYQILKNEILFYQRFLKSAGFYAGPLDGIWGPITRTAEADFITKTKSIIKQFGYFDNRSESNIITLQPVAQIEARKFLELTKAQQIDVKIISGTRTYAKQNVLYEKGRSGPPPIVTNAKGGQSNHNFGIAWDIGIFDSNGGYNTNDADYKSLAAAILPNLNTIEWGGNWLSFKDYSHYQLKAISEDVGTIRSLFENGKTFI